VARFRDRVAIVTGAEAPGGIGAAVARALVAEGGRVVPGAALDQCDSQLAQHRGDLRVVVVLSLGQRLRYLLADRLQ
jgi:3-oxoacyl-[acyl-carrier protein] reductase